MPLVKAQHSEQLRQSAIVMDLADLERQAGEIVGRARAEGERILAEARMEAAQEAIGIKETARRAGEAEGLAAGTAAGQQKGHDEAVLQATEGLKGLIERWTGTLDALQNNMPSHIADERADLIKLALAIAGRVTKLEAVANKDVLKANVEGALGLVGAGRTVAIHVHPDELVVLEGYVPTLLAKMRQISAIELKADETLTPGDCQLRFGAGEIDGRLQEQVDRIARELLAEAQ